MSEVSRDDLFRAFKLETAEVESLRAQNAELLAALEAVDFDLRDPDSESWVTPVVGRRVRAAIAAAKGVQP